MAKRGTVGWAVLFSVMKKLFYDTDESWFWKQIQNKRHVKNRASAAMAIFAAI